MRAETSQKKRRKGSTARLFLLRKINKRLVQVLGLEPEKHGEKPNSSYGNRKIPAFCVKNQSHVVVDTALLHVHILPEAREKRNKKG